MPYTPYHFGPSGFVGLVLRRWVDVVVFMLANVLIDLEVAAMMAGLVHGSAHRVLHFHTLLVGGLLGGLFGAGVYLVVPIRKSVAWMMDRLRISYRGGLVKSVISGVLGAWFHVLIDSCYHHDVEMFWPMKVRANTYLYRWMIRGHKAEMHHKVETVCLVFGGLMIIAYVFAVRSYMKQKDKPILEESK